MEPVLESFIQVKPELSSGVKVLTYNVLAQGLVRRDVYPTNGDAIKWTQRRPAFAAMIRHYDPDIMVLQEVDCDHHKEFVSWMIGELPNFVFARFGSKTHGLLVVSKQSITDRIDVDLGWNSNSPQQQISGGNIGLFVRTLTPHGRPIWVGTAHLYWHPHADYERARQLLLLAKTAHTLEKERNESVCLAGDFNSTPTSPAYVLATTGTAPAEQTKMLEESVTTEVFGAFNTLQRPRTDTTIPGNATYLLPNSRRRAVRALIDAWEQLRSSGFKLYSVYGICQEQSSTSNADTGGEPPFTNWTDGFRDTIDYIFTTKFPIVNKLLKLPTPAELGPEPSSIPRMRGGRGWPSDHVPLMAEMVI